MVMHTILSLLCNKFLYVFYRVFIAAEQQLCCLFKSCALPTHQVPGIRGHSPFRK